MFASEIRKWLLTFEVTIVAFDFVYSLLNIIATHFHQTYWNNLNTLYVNTAVFYFTILQVHGNNKLYISKTNTYAIMNFSIRMLSKASLVDQTFI